VFDPVTTEEAAWAIAAASLNREMLSFSLAIKRYLQTMLAQDGLESDPPAVFDNVFEPDEAEESLRDTLAEIYRSPNHDNIERMIDDQLQDMASQFNQIPSLSTVDDMLISGQKESLVDAL
jgi:hypothetical protein